MLKKILRFYLVLALVVLLPGCAAVAVTGMATGASVAAGARTTGTVVEDQAIELKAEKLFYVNEEFNELTHINVTSYNTVVLLTGEAPSEELKAHAAALVGEIEKVTQIYNEITIAAPSSLMSRSSDSLVTAKVKTRLLTDEGVPAVNIKVVTENGVVFLMGVLTRADAERATEITRQTGGVQKVVKLFQYID